MLKALTIEQVRDVVEMAGSYRGRRGAHAASRVHLEHPKKRVLCRTIKKLSPAARRELTAVMWIGRGIYQVAEWSVACRDATANQNDADLVYMIDTGALGEHLARGLTKLTTRLEPA